LCISLETGCFMDHRLSLLLFGSQVRLTLLGVFFDDSQEFWVVSQVESFDIGLDVALFNLSLDVEEILSSHFFGLNNVVDDTGRELLSSH
jgi:hypothetical protein